MRINIIGRHIEVTEAIHDYVEKKISKLSKYYNRISGIAKRLALIKEANDCAPLFDTYDPGEIVDNYKLDIVCLLFDPLCQFQ